MARTDKLICGSQTVVDNMYEVLGMETERRPNDDFHALRRPNLACKIVSIEPDSPPYLLGVSTESATDRVNRVQN